MTSHLMIRSKKLAAICCIVLLIGCIKCDVSPKKLNRRQISVDLDKDYLSESEEDAPNDSDETDLSEIQIDDPSLEDTSSGSSNITDDLKNFRLDLSDQDRDLLINLLLDARDQFMNTTLVSNENGTVFENSSSSVGETDTVRPVGLSVTMADNSEEGTEENVVGKQQLTSTDTVDTVGGKMPPPTLPMFDAALQSVLYQPGYVAYPAPSGSAGGYVVYQQPYGHALSPPICPAAFNKNDNLKNSTQSSNTPAPICYPGGCIVFQKQLTNDPSTNVQTSSVTPENVTAIPSPGIYPGGGYVVFIPPGSPPSDQKTGKTSSEVSDGSNSSDKPRNAPGDEHPCGLPPNFSGTGDGAYTSGNCTSYFCSYLECTEWKCTSYPCTSGICTKKVCREWACDAWSNSTISASSDEEL